MARVCVSVGKPEARAATRPSPLAQSLGIDAIGAVTKLGVKAVAVRGGVGGDAGAASGALIRVSYKAMAARRVPVIRLGIRYIVILLFIL